MPFTSLDYRGVVAIGGPDRQKFLQGLVTQDVALTGPDRALYAILLTPQGKFLHDLFIIETGDALWLDCEAARIGDLIQRLSRYKLRSEIDIADVSAEYGVAISSDKTPVDEPGRAQRYEDGFMFTDPRLSALGRRMILPRAKLPPRNDAVLHDCEYSRLTLGVPDGSRDMIPGESILLEYNLEQLNAISFSKGCYIGQELTARTYHRALIKKRLFPVRIEGPCPAPDSPVIAGGQTAGVMRSALGDAGLAMIKLDAVRAKAVLHCGETKLVPFFPQWLHIDTNG
ncbi:MAG: folate-binding protein [Alphaproteobacteria bacterium]